MLNHFNYSTYTLDFETSRRIIVKLVFDFCYMLKSYVSVATYNLNLHYYLDIHSPMHNSVNL